MSTSHQGSRVRRSWDVTLGEAAAWLGVPKDDDLDMLLLVPPFRRAVVFVASGTHRYVFRDPYPGGVLDKFHVPTNRNGDLDLEWLRDVALKCQQKKL